MDPAAQARFQHDLEESMRHSDNTYSYLKSSGNQQEQLEACKEAVLGESEFQDLPRAAVSVHPGSNSHHISFSVRWEGTTGHGNCKVSSNGYVEHVKITKYHQGQTNHHQGGSGVPQDIDGFYYDRDSGLWRDSSDGRACHTCTPENGFPAGQ